MKTAHLISTTFLLALFLTSCNKDKDKEYGTLVFQGLPATSLTKSLIPNQFCGTVEKSDVHIMHTADLEVNIAEIWASQGLVSEGVYDDFTWFEIGKGQDLKLISDYNFTSDHMPVGEYKSLKIVFRNKFSRIGVFQSDLSTSMKFTTSLGETGCGNDEIITLYFSKNGNHNKVDGIFKCSSRGENIRGFSIKPNEVTTIFWKLGGPEYKLTDCTFVWTDNNDNGAFECETDRSEFGECNGNVTSMWHFSVDDGEIDPFIPNAVTDVDGNSYDAVRIGDQVWLTSNLKTTRMNDGTLFMSQEQYQQHCDSGLCPPPSEKLPFPQFAFPNNQSELVDYYGLLYNWNAANKPKLCPSGWHIPTKEEWDKLITFLGTNAGGKLKIVQFEPGYNWHQPNTGATNEYEFAALPAGCFMGPASGLNELNVGYGINALFFSSTNESDNPMMPKIPFYILTSNSGDIAMNWASYDCFMSCRCVQD